MPCNSGDFPSVALKVSCVLSTWTEGFPTDRASMCQRFLHGPFSSLSCDTTSLGDSMISFGMKFMVTHLLDRTLLLFLLLEIPSIFRQKFRMFVAIARPTRSRADSSSLYPRWRYLLVELQKQCWAFRGLLANAKVPLRLFEDEISGHRSQHKDEPY